MRLSDEEPDGPGVLGVEKRRGGLEWVFRAMRLKASGTGEIKIWSVLAKNFRQDMVEVRWRRRFDFLDLKASSNGHSARNLRPGQKPVR